MSDDELNRAVLRRRHRRLRHHLERILNARPPSFWEFRDARTVLDEVRNIASEALREDASAAIRAAEKGEA